MRIVILAGLFISLGSMAQEVRSRVWERTEEGRWIDSSRNADLLPNRTCSQSTRCLPDSMGVIRTASCDATGKRVECSVSAGRSVRCESWGRFAQDHHLAEAICPQ
jgi:hypothetical protein